MQETFTLVNAFNTLIIHIYVAQHLEVFFFTKQF